MTPASLPEQSADFEQLRRLVLTHLAQASVGNFTSKIEIPSGASSDLKEILVGFQMLIDTAREQATEIHRLEAELARTKQRTANALEEMLNKSLSTDDRAY